MDFRRRTRPLRAIWGPSLIRRLVRHRLVWWGLAAIFALLGGTQLHGRFEAVEAARADWGETEQVMVLLEAVAAGDPIAGSVVGRDIPRAVVPPSAARSVAEDALAKVALHEGEVLLVPRVTGDDERGLPAGSAAMTLQLFGRAPLIETGDLVDIWVVDSANLSSRRVAQRLVVLARSDADLTVAIPHDQVAEATVAALRPVTAVLVG